MKKLIAVAVLLFFFQTGWSQNTYLDYRFAVKFYNLSTYADYGKSTSDINQYPFGFTDTRLRILHPTFAFQWKTKKKNFHEIELTDFMLGITGKNEEIDTAGNGQPIYGDELITKSISARYEYILNFNKLKNTKFIPSLGFAINPYFGQFHYSPGAPNDFQTSEKYIGAKVFVTPRIMYNLSQKVFFDLNIPVCLFDMYFQSYKDENPTLSIEEQKTNTLNFYEFPKLFSLRVGVGIKF
jgi:hypothetical protein